MHKSSISSVKIATGMFMLLFSSLLLPTFYLPSTLLYFILMHFISFHFPFMRVTSMSFHYLFISFHCPYMSCPKSSQIEYSECVTVVTMVVTIYMREYWKNTNTHIQIAFPFVFVPFPFHFCSHSFHAFLFSCQFPFTSFHVPSISINHIFVVCLPYLISLLSFCSFMSFWCSSDFPFRSFHFLSDLPFMSLSFYSLVTSVSFPFSFKSFHFSCMSYHFLKNYRMSAHVRFIFFS